MDADKNAFGGLLAKRERWGLSLRGWLLVFLVLLAAVVTVARGLYPFLAITSRTSGPVMVVEGWIRFDTVGQAVSEYRSANYQSVVVVAAVFKADDKWDEGRGRADYITATFARLGVPRDRTHVVFCNVVQKDRTYESALATREWLRKQGMPTSSLDVFTMGPHARRSRLLFQKAFGPEVKIGVVAMNEREYDPVHWWHSSEGVREVLFEGIAYVYAKWFFVP